MEISFQNLGDIQSRWTACLPPNKGESAVHPLSTPPPLSLTLSLSLPFQASKYSGVRYNERCYNEQFLSIKSGCYNEGGKILSADVSRACPWRVGPSRFD